MMTLAQTIELYASILRQLLPVGGYDSSPHTAVLAVDIYAHAKVLAQADVDAKRILSVLESIPPELLSEYEQDYGLPMQCTTNIGRSIQQRIEILHWVRKQRNVFNRLYLEQILAVFGLTLLDLIRYVPMQCTASCTSAINTDRLRYKVLLKLQAPINTDMNCLIEHYLPAYLRIDYAAN